MREIKFKGKRTDNGEWVHGYLVRAGKHENGKTHKVFYIAMNRYDYASIFNVDTCDDTFIWRRVDENTVCQYTGLKDKNGVEIYEGDIVLATYKEIRDFNGVKYESEIQSIETVVFNEEKAAFELQIDIDGVKLYRGLVIGEKVNNVELISLEVIGNIFDNPELLKGDKQ